MTILSVNLLKNRFTVEWAHFHAHDSPTGQSRQRLRGHTRHGDTTSPDHPRCHRAGHRGRRHRSAPAEQHTGHRHGHGTRHPRLHGQVHPRTGQGSDDHGRGLDRGNRPLFRQPPRCRGGLGRRHRDERQGHLGLHDSEREQPGLPRHRDRRGRHARGDRHRRLHQLDALPTHGFPLPLQAHRPRGHRRAHHLRGVPLPEAAGLHRQAQPGLPHQRAAVLRLAVPPRAARRHR